MHSHQGQYILHYINHQSINPLASINHLTSINQTIGINDNMIQHDIESRLVEYVNINEDIEITLQQISIDYREIEGTLFYIKVKHKVIVSPLRDYIEKWLNSALIKITVKNQI
jgi:hypothetical protein